MMQWRIGSTLLPPRLRAAALMPAAVLTVHQLRYQLAFGGHTEQKLAAEGHAYLARWRRRSRCRSRSPPGSSSPRLARARREGEAGRARRARSFLRLAARRSAPRCSALYSCQELLEGMLSTGHPGGLDGVFGDGGFWAVPLAARLRRRRRRRPCAGRAPRSAGPPPRHRVPGLATGARARASRPARIAMPRPVPLAGAAAGRAPPLALRTR